MICDDPVASTICQQAADQVGSAAVGIFDWLADGVGEAAAFLLEGLWSVMDSTTVVDLSTEQFTRVYGLVFGVAVFLMLAFFLFQLITGMLYREPGALGRALSGLAKSVLGSFVVVMLTGLLLEIVDQVCLALVAAAGTSMEEMGAEIIALATLGTVGSALAPKASALLALFLAGLVAGAALIVWFSLLMRKALLLIAIALAPIALAGASWDATRGWVARWAQFVVALVVSKLVMVVVFLLATTLTASPIAADLTTWSDKFTGVVLLLVAGFAPYLTYKAIAFMGFDMYHAMSIEQESKAALNRPVPIAAGSAGGGMAMRNVQKVLHPGGDKNGGGGGSSAGGSAGGAGSSAAARGGASVGSQAGAAGGKAAATKTAATGGAGAATAGAAVPLIVAARAAKSAATAGPKAGGAVGSAAGQHAGEGSQAPAGASPALGTRRSAARPAASSTSAAVPPALPARDIPTVVTKKGEKR